MKNNFRRVFHILIGTLFILVGIAGLILPILNGTIFLIIGLIIISFENPYVEKKLYTLTQKNTLLHSLYIKLEKITRKIFRV